ncbi:AAA family ATPase [candidate division NPL-UPA2 bacterium]|nr:AAA family ATPase [candidate division NPL-UPA2 bacterium]
MYEEYWGLKEKPFENTPDPRFLYRSEQHEEALMRLLYAVEERKGAAMLTGVFGCGKTLLGYALLDKLDKAKFRVAFLTNLQLEPVELLRAIAYNLGVTDLPRKKTEVLADFLLQVIKETLINNLNDGKDTVVIIDEAHGIESREIFEQLRLLLNFQLKDRFLLTLLLFGQPELRTEVDNLKPLEQRIAIKCYLDRMGEEDSQNYIKHRLEVAGAEKEIFTEEAIKAIHEGSGGIPRRINQIGDMSLLTGFGRKTERIDEELIQAVVKDIGG